MNKQVEIIRKTRSLLLENLKDLSVEQFNHIPEGFNNNIIWNLGHMVAAQQGVCYIRAGLTPPAGEDFFNTYKTGTKPEKFVDNTGVEDIKTLLFTTIDQFETDYNDHLFDGYTAWSLARYGVELANIDDAISFLSFHDALHLGYINILKKLVSRVTV